MFYRNQGQIGSIKLDIETTDLTIIILILRIIFTVNYNILQISNSRYKY